jgi:hypothetical protein
MFYRFEGDPEREPQRRNALVEGKHAAAARQQMELVAAHAIAADVNAGYG